MRISWEEYALRLAFTASLRSEDLHKKVGACILRHDNSVASLGYNGPPSGVEIDWSDRDERRKRVIHAEASALKWIKPEEGRLIAVTLAPCPNCVNLIASYGIRDIIYLTEYEQDMERLSFKLCKEFKIKIRKITLK